VKCIITHCFIDYGGISASRLEVLEERLRDDIVSELMTFGGKYADDILQWMSFSDVNF
jgi:hypothetical protein